MIPKIQGIGMGCLFGIMLCIPTFPGQAKAQAPADAVMDQANPHGPLGLDQALRLALERNAGLIARAAALRSELEQARNEAALSNPTVEFTDENFGGGVSQLEERTLSVSQPLPLLSRIGKRKGVVNALERLARVDQDAARRELALATSDAFLEAWWLQERLVLLRRSEQVSRSAIGAAEERTRMGAAPVVEALRARAATAERQIERRRAEADLDIARADLAVLWGDTLATFDSLFLQTPAEPPRLDTLIVSIDQRPELRRARAETQVAEARWHAARAERFPELSLMGGVRHLEEVGETGFLAGVSATLPIFTGGGAVRAAEAEYRATQTREALLRRGLTQRITVYYRRLIAAQENYETAGKDGEPAAREALQNLSEGYRAGRFTYLDYIEGQRAALDAQLSTLDALKEYWGARVSLEWAGGAAP
jgi:outer membrane protein, heavy metal efflux system